MKNGDTVRILLLQEGESWAAQCIEYDIAAQGKTISDALHDIQRMFCVYEIASKEQGIDNPWAVLGPAPERYAKRFDAASHLDKRPPRFVCGDDRPMYDLSQQSEVRVDA